MTKTMNQLAISIAEFGQMLRACRPPDGWSNSIAVAHSGGADSTCLLYLLHCWLAQHGTEEFPHRMLSLSVDHSLQPGSSAAAEHCRRFSEDLHIPSQILRIPWSRPPFPDCPKTNGPMETVARQARYRLLLNAMKDSDTSVIAMGHHADDQVETLIMRLAPTKAAGIPPGMRRCRRWGMGSSSKSLDWAGSSGMHHWIVRPLLDVPKDRILATCEMHGLRYIDDHTNFQPLLTQRNFVRHCLSGQPMHLDVLDRSEGTLYDVDKVKRAIDQLVGISTRNSEESKSTPLPARLHAAASSVLHLQSCVDKEATRYLVEFRKPSPPSTLLLLPSAEGPIPTEDVQRAVVLRILRFVSPKPWGAPDSEARRRSSSLRLISSQLWSSTTKATQTFCAGSEVVWRPVLLRADGRMRFVNDGHIPLDRRGWLASRQPPMKRTRVLSPCVRDISECLAQDEESEVVWDNRYALTLRSSLLPTEIRDSCRSEGSVMVVPHGKWLLPEIVWLRTTQKDSVLGGVDLDVRDRSVVSLSPQWVNFRWIRSLEAI